MINELIINSGIEIFIKKEIQYIIIFNKLLILEFTCKTFIFLKQIKIKPYVWNDIFIPYFKKYNYI